MARNRRWPCSVSFRAERPSCWPTGSLGRGAGRSDRDEGASEHDGETGAFGRRMLRVPGLRRDWVG
jgi:hypothetical protein